MARTTETGPGNSLAVAHRQPVISRELERELAQRWRDHGDTAARDLLVRSQLRNVVEIARRYRRYSGATLDDLIAEGNFGLVKALAKFDPERGTRFVTYAVYWIRAYMLQYLVRTRSMVTTGVKSKVLSRIRRAREEIVKANGEGTDVDEQIAQRLALSPVRLRSLLERMEVHDVSWDPATQDTPGGSLASSLSLSSSVEDTVMAAETGMWLTSAVSAVLSKLDERERFIIEQRLMAHSEDELSLADIGRHFGVSRERARQLEARAMRKVKAGLAQASLGMDMLVSRRAA